MVTEPKKAVVALKWVVQEMENRYRKMAKIGVRNIDGFNERMAEARRTGEQLSRRVQTGFDADTGEAIFEEEVIEPESLPFIIVVVDEMADLMMVAGKEIENAVQRLAQMARAAIGKLSGDRFHAECAATGNHRHSRRFIGVF